MNHFSIDNYRLLVVNFFERSRCIYCIAQETPGYNNHMEFERSILAIKVSHFSDIDAVSDVQVSIPYSNTQTKGTHDIL